MNWKHLITILLIGISSLNSQTLRDKLRINGQIKEGKNKLGGVRLSLQSEGEEVSAQTTGKNGRFTYVLDLQKNYFLVFSKRGYRSKYIEIRASDIPEEDAAYGFEFGGLAVSLFKDIKGLKNNDVLDEPVAEIIYDTDIYKFVFNVNYFEEIEEEMDSLKEELELLSANEPELLAMQEKALIEERDEELKFEKEKQEALEKMATKRINSDIPNNSITLANNTNTYDKIKKELEAKEEEQKRLEEEAQKEEEALLALAKEEEEERLKLEAEARALKEEKEKQKELEKQKALEEEQIQKEQELLEAKLIAEVKRKEELAKAKALEEERKRKEAEIAALKAKLAAEEKAKAIAKANELKEEKLDDLAAENVPPGITKEVYRKGNKTITELSVNQNGIITTFKKVIADWGGKYYFKDDVAITQVDWELETQKYSEK